MSIEEFFAQAEILRTDELVCLAEDAQRLAIHPLENGQWLAIYYAGNPDKCVHISVDTQAEAVARIRQGIKEREQAKFAQTSPNILQFRVENEPECEMNLWDWRPALPVKWYRGGMPQPGGTDRSRYATFGPLVLHVERENDKIRWSIVSLHFHEISRHEEVEGFRWELGASAVLANLPAVMEHFAQKFGDTEHSPEQAMDLQHLLALARTAAAQGDVVSG